MEQKKISILSLVIASVILLLIEFLSMEFLTGAGLHPLVVIGLARIAQIASMLTILSVAANGFESVGLHKSKVGTGLKKGFAWSAGFGFFVLICLGVLYLLDYNMPRLLRSTVNEPALGIFLLFLVGGFISPLAEEIYFRGMLYGCLRRWSRMLAILGSTALFAMAHFMTSGVIMVQIIGGLLFALAYEMEQNLLVPITIHVLGNTAIFTLSIVLI